MRDSRAYLLDMLLEARLVLQFIGDVEWESFEKDPLLIRGVTKSLENIGEAARQLLQRDPGMRDRHPEIPWTDIVGMRTVLAHEYFRVDVATLWRVATKRVPELIANLEPLIPPETP